MAVLFVVSCSPKTADKAKDAEEEIEVRDLEPVIVETEMAEPEPETFELPKYNPEYTRTHDLIHTILDVRFDWAKQRCMGKATLEFTPLFYTTDKIRLDAKNFDIHKVQLKSAGNKTLKYEYDNMNLVIQLDRPYKKGEKFQLYIDYTAKPTEMEIGGSSAITSDQGLFFINHDGSEGDKPMQIWTQGETEHNSKWFPTVDKPNERCTQEMYITVDKKYTTLSNGLLKKQTPNADGTRTDYWVMDKPHAPYLFMMAIGEFAYVKDTWNGMEVGYYVEKEYEQYARNIFPYTPEMLTFFSEKFGKYPWSKYSQVVVRDYVSGAMENTTGVIFGEFMNGTDRDLVDVANNERIVAHEMMHHWFGDLVTCESWANLPLNEAFANYSEYMWAEYKHGRVEADNNLRNEMRGYIQSARTSRHPLIYFGYDKDEDMFDAHSYNKGGCILHMLRKYVGDEAFYESLRVYLDRHEYTAVEAHELRMAFEDVTGKDLNWFFNQWFYEQGHPEISVKTSFNDAANTVSVTLEQTQDPKRNPAIFQLPLTMVVYAGGKKEIHEVWVKERNQTFTFKTAAKPDWVDIDHEDQILGVVSYEERTEAENIFIYKNAPTFADRYDALNAIKGNESAAAKAVIKQALGDKSRVIRGLAVASADKEDPAMLAKIKTMATSDKHAAVRSASVKALGSTGNKAYASTLESAMKNDKANRVTAAALSAISDIDPARAMTLAKDFENSKNPRILEGVSSIYVKSGDLKYLDFFERNFTKLDGYAAIDFFGSYYQLLEKSDDASMISSKLANVQKIATDMGQSPWRRYSVTKGMADMRNFLRTQDDATKATRNTAVIAAIDKSINAIKAAETEDQLKNLYKQF